MNRRIPSHPVAGGVLLALVALSPAPMALAAVADLERRIAECAGLSEPSDRLACFDSIAADAAPDAGRSPLATDPPPQPEPPRASRQPAPPAPAAPPVDTPAPDLRSERQAVTVPRAPEPAVESPDASFGAEMLERPGDDERDRGAQQMSAELVRLEEQPRGERVFYLSNDQVWVELAPGRGLFREGQAVTVRRALMGGYMLQAEGVRGSRVRRIR